jgi:hypothetical protein
MKGILLDIRTGDLKINVIRDSQGKITNGLVVGNSDYQNVNLIIQSQKGEFKEVPTLGFGIDNYLNSPDTIKQKFVNELEKELESGGYKTKVTLGDSLFEFDINLKK